MSMPLLASPWWHSLVKLWPEFVSILADNLWDMILSVFDVMMTGRKVTETEILAAQSLVQPFLGEEWGKEHQKEEQDSNYIKIYCLPPSDYQGDC